MKTKLLLLLFFVPVHAFLSLTVLQRGFNPPPGGNSVFFQFFSAVIMSPLLLLLAMVDPDGDRLPKWMQFGSVPLNSLVWGIGLLLLVYGIKRWRRSQAHG